MNAPSSSSPTHSRDRELVFSLGAVVVVAILIRVIFAFQASDADSMNRLLVDAEAYDQAARGWLDGSWPGDEPYYQDPLYPYFLGVHYKLIGDSISQIRTTQHLLGILGIVCFFLLVREFFQTRVALVAGILASCMSTRLFYEGLALKTILGLVLFEAALLATVLVPKKRPPWSLALGALFAACVLVRANLLLLFPLACLWALRLWPGQNRDEENPGLSKRWLRFGTILSGFVITLAPFTWHNISSGTFVLTTSQAGPNFYIGNNPDNETGSYHPPPGVRAHPFFERVDFTRLAEEAEGRALSPKEVSSYWFDQAFEFMADEPKQAFLLLCRKAGLFINHFEVPDNVDLGRTRQEIALLRAPLPAFWFLWILGLLGFMLVKKSSKVTFFGAMFLVFAASVIGFFIFARYRLTVLPLLIPFAALAPFELKRALGEKAWLRLGIATAVAALGAILSFQTLYETRREVTIYNDAINAIKDGDKERGRDLLLEAMKINPNYLDAKLRYGMILTQTGDPVGAETSLREILDRTPEDPLAWRELGKALAAQQKSAEALSAYAQALELDPAHVPAVVGAAVVEHGLGQRQKAKDRLQAWIDTHPDVPGVAINLGVFLAQDGDFVNAEKAFRHELRVDPNNAGAKQYLDRTLKALGR